MQVSVLGSVGVRRNGADAELGARLSRLLAALSVSNGSVVSTDRLVDIVWAGTPPAGAEKTLRSYVTRLRQALAADRDELIVFRQPGYALDLRPGELDSAVFDDELDRALQHLRTADATTAGELLTVAIGRWRGPAYAGFADEDWARPESVRLQERLVEAREALVEARLADGMVEQAVADAQALVESEPLRERPRSLLMRSLYASGRQAEALRVFGSYRRYLAEETGLDPSDDLVELEGRIARSELGTGGPSQALRSYDVGERIGEGAFAVVHRAVQRGIDREVAIKIIRAELADRPEFIRRFELEAQTVARLEHPHVVPLYDFWREPGAAYLVMRWLRGGTVESALRARGPYSREQTMRLIDDVSGALETAHRAGVVHRDVRPANLLLDADGTTYLADFGIALPTATADDLPIVSPAYAAPEVLRGDPAGVAADVLSLGVTVFEVLTGRLPFADSTDRAEVVRRQLTEPLPPVRATRTELPPQVDEVLARATAKVAGDRYPTVATFVADLRVALGADAVRTARADLVGPGRVVENPYVGLYAFDEPDADRFFGREALVAELVDELETRPMVAVVGPSGSGKSSVVRAGLLPAIRSGAVPGSDAWFVTTMVPGADPVDALETALLRVAVNPPATLREQLADPGGLLRAIRRVLPDDRARILLVVDQFEELFTQVRDPDERDHFLTELASAITHPASPLRVVATLRADHYDAPLRHLGMADLVTAGTVTVRPMSPEELDRAITLPARSVGVELEPALAAELVAGVSARPSALPLLQFSLTELFDRRVADTLLLSTHRELGGLTGALAARADRILADGDPDDDAEVRRIFGRLVTLGEGVEDTRRRALRSEFGAGERTAWLLDAYITARLLTTDHDPATRQPTVEIAHEALLRDWPRLRTWLAEDRADLRTLHAVGAAADAWAAADRDPGELARGGRLETVIELATRRPELLTDTETEWAATSTETADAEAAAQAASIEHDRRQNRRLRGLLVVAVILVVVAVGAAAGALVLRNRAIESERQADNAREDAEIERLVAVSANQLGAAPDVAILLALEANRRRDDLATRSTIHRAIATEQRRVGIFPNRFAGVEAYQLFSSDGSIGVAYTVTGDVEWFDPSTGALLHDYTSDEGLFEVAVAGDGSVVALSREDRTIEFVRRGATGPVLSVEGPGVQGSGTGCIDCFALPAIDDTGSIGAYLNDGVLHVVEIATGNVLVRHEYGGSVEVAGSSLSFGDDGSTVHLVLVSPGANSLVRVDTVDVTTGAVSERPVGPEGSEYAIVTRVAADGRLVVANPDVVRVFAPDGEVTELPGHEDVVVAMALDGDRLMTAGLDDVARFWSLDGSEFAPPLSLPGQVDAVAFGPGNTAVASLVTGNHYVFDLDGGVAVRQRWSLDGPAATQIWPVAPYYDTLSVPDGTLEIRRLDDNSVVRVLDDASGFSEGLLTRPFLANDGEWMMVVPAVPRLEDEGGVLVMEVHGDRTFSLDPDALFEEIAGAEVFADDKFMRPENGGDRLFFKGIGDDGSHLSAWVDNRTGAIVDGPFDHGGDSAWSHLLDDGRVVVGGRDVITILAADLDEEAVLVDVDTGLFPFDEDAGSGRVLLTGNDGTVALLDPDAPEINYLERATGLPTWGAFSPDGDLVAVATKGDGLQLFDVATGRRLGVPMGPESAPDGARGIAWAEDGTGVWVVSRDGPVLLAADPDEWRRIACSIVHRELTEVEWRDFVSETIDPIPACDPAADR